MNLLFVLPGGVILKYTYKLRNYWDKKFSDVCGTLIKARNETSRSSHSSQEPRGSKRNEIERILREYPQVSK